MAVRHKFEHVPPALPGIAWPAGFETHNAILDVTPYKPEVIIIGTFNHGWAWNDADFFYGRGMYMWTIMANLFLHNANDLIDRRNPPPGNNIPTLNQIFDICEKGRLCFADVVLGTSGGIPTVVNLPAKTITVNGGYAWNTHSDAHLNVMGGNGWLDSNVQNIIDFIGRTPSIKHIHFTFSTGGVWLLGLRAAIIAAFPHACSIYTPTGMRLPNYPGFPHRPWSLAHHWVWNNMAHPAVPVANPKYCHLDHDWLIRHGVNPNNF